MLGKSDLGFKRQNFVKELYKPKWFLNDFDMVELENMRVLHDVMSKDYYVPRKELRIHIETHEDFNAIKEIITNSRFCESCRLSLIIDNYEILESFEGLDRHRFGLIVKPDFDYNVYRDKLKAWYTSSPLYFKFRIGFDNIDFIIEDLIALYNKEKARLFDLKFDYQSFEKATFHDIHRILFRISRLSLWADDKLPESSRMEFKRYGFHKPIFVDSNLNLYYNYDHYKEGIISPLFRLREGVTGEDIPFMELNAIRQYMDIKKEIMVPRMNKGLGYIDFYQNVLIQRVAVEIPAIAQHIMRWAP